MNPTNPARLPSLVRFELVTAMALLAVADGRSPGEVADRVLAREAEPRRAAIARPFLLVMAAAVPQEGESSDADEVLGRMCLGAMADAWRGAHGDMDEWEVVDILFATYRAALRELGEIAGLPVPEVHGIVRALGEAARRAALADPATPQAPAA
jgi:hypothetical protein